MSSFSTTVLVGGNDGAISQDILFLDGDNNIVINNANKNQLDLKHPILQIAISCGWVVDGFSVTYQLGDGSSTTMTHGSQFSPSSAVITFNANEKLVGVYGRAGLQTYYNRSLINNISFVIFDTVAGTTRTAGPYGNGSKSNQGTPFYVSDVMAFGSFAQPNAATVGLSGVFFYKS
ncbi:hypothetical protein BN946_scf184766.g27 [Trametes cinnabarina]|uniref:Jacalin-type lectin domain-containing protein n=1 Tax=Pycnoporus cinnabarinus TaxID=5643 RepID=A0A060S5T2_PYCCI|nr:hypothetical protein BN946_scf184766.g27 [Trametes cinnabarina]